MTTPLGPSPVPTPVAPPDPDAILATVAARFGIPASRIRGRARDGWTSAARQRVVALWRSELQMPYPEIGRRLGGRDHTTALYLADPGAVRERRARAGKPRRRSR